MYFRCSKSFIIPMIDNNGNKYGEDIRIKRGTIFKSLTPYSEIKETDKSVRLEGANQFITFDIVKKDFVDVFKAYCPTEIADKLYDVLSHYDKFPKLTRVEENGEVYYVRENGRKFSFCNIPEKYKVLVQNYDFSTSDTPELADYLN